MPGAAGIVSALREVLIEDVPFRFPSMDVAARKLSIHPRTLRRRLEEQGTTYREIVADIRKALAIDYLEKTNLTTDEIAARLGYSDAANFRNAFARWTGKTTRVFRGGYL